MLAGNCSCFHSFLRNEYKGKSHVLHMKLAGFRYGLP